MHVLKVALIDFTEELIQLLGFHFIVDYRMKLVYAGYNHSAFDDIILRETYNSEGIFTQARARQGIIERIIMYTIYPVYANFS